MIQAGERVHVVQRRLFEQEPRRHLVGQVVGAEYGILRVEGYSFVFDSDTGGFIRLPQKRQRLVSATDAGNLITILPRNVNPDQIVYKVNDQRRIVLSDGTLELEITESVPAR